MKKKTCRNPNCKKEFVPVKGCREHCTIICYKEAKRIRQAKTDDLIKEFRKGICANTKLFEMLLPKSGSAETDLTEARVKGFNQHAFYTTFKDKDESTWCRVGVYYFFISSDNKILNLYKKINL